VKKTDANKNNIKRKEQGFTLLELLISFVLVILLITATAQLVIQSLFIQKRAESNFKTAELAYSKLEYLKSLPYESDELKEAVLTEFIEEGAFNTYQREWRIEEVASNMKKIEIKCFARSCPSKNIKLTLFLSRELGF
jgi:Tfp pilus assembly protein PilV